jgi:hypothetical protein
MRERVWFLNDSIVGVFGTYQTVRSCSVKVHGAPYHRFRRERSDLTSLLLLPVISGDGLSSANSGNAENPCNLRLRGRPFGLWADPGRNPSSPVMTQRQARAENRSRPW